MALGATPLMNHFISTYLPSASELQLKVYIYGLLAATYPTKEMTIQVMARDLDATEADIIRAYRYWERLGLVVRVSDNPPAYSYQPVDPNALTGERDLKYEKFSEQVFALFGNSERIHGKTVLQYYEWVEDMGLSEGVVLELLRYMISTRGKHFSMESARKLAVTLSEQKVISEEDAKRVLEYNRQALECSRRILRRFNFRREPTEVEMEMAEKWMKEWGFTPDEILDAVNATGNAMTPSFGYVEGVLKGRMKGGAPMDRASISREEEEREMLKAVYMALGQTNGPMSKGMLDLLRDMRSKYPDDIILIASAECAKRGGKLADAMTLLESWKKKNLETREQIEQYIRHIDECDRVIHQLGEIWGVALKGGEVNREHVDRWSGNYGFSQEQILHAAPWASGTARPMSYLDRILKNFFDRGIRTAEQMDADHVQAKSTGQSAQTGSRWGSGTVIEQRYEQRPNTEPDADEVPEWIRKIAEEQERKKAAEGQEEEGHVPGSTT